MNQISNAQLERIFGLRIVFERQCARLAAHCATGRQLQRLDRLLTHLMPLQDSDSDGLAGMDRRCHRLLDAAPDNNLLIDTAERLHDRRHSSGAWYTAPLTTGGSGSSSIAPSAAR